MSRRKGLAKRRVLLTGHRGAVGWWLHRYLRRRGYEVVGFDIRDGNDVRDPKQLTRAAAGSDAIVHCAVLQWNWDGPETVMREVNLLGGLNALEAARAAGMGRAVMFSSVMAFGVFEDGRLAESFPIRDSHPLLAQGSYGRQKAELEAASAAFAEETGIPVFCPRPAHVMVPGQPADITRRLRGRPVVDAGDFWDRAAWVDVRDVARAVHLALQADLPLFSTAILAANDSSSPLSTAEGLATFAPAVPADPAWLAGSGRHASLFDNSQAFTLLGWAPEYSWAAESRLSWPTRGWGRLRRVPTYGLHVWR